MAINLERWSLLSRDSILIETIFTSWFFVTIVVPIALPFVGLGALKAVPLPAPQTGQPDPLRMITIVKDGQLGWTVIAMGSASVYELLHGIEKKHLPIPSWAVGTMLGIVMLMLIAMVLAAAGAVFSTPILNKNDHLFSFETIKHYSVLVASAFSTIVSAALYTFIHFYIDP